MQRKKGLKTAKQAPQEKLLPEKRGHGAMWRTNRIHEILKNQRERDRGVEPFVNYDWLAVELEVARSTIELDIGFMRETLDLPIRLCRETAGHLLHGGCRALTQCADHGGRVCSVVRGTTGSGVVSRNPVRRQIAVGVRKVNGGVEVRDRGRCGSIDVDHFVSAGLF